MVNGHLVNVPQHNMLPSITEYDNDSVDVTEDPCYNCEYCGANMCDECSCGMGQAYENIEPIYPKFASTIERGINEFSSPEVIESFYDAASVMKALFESGFKSISFADGELKNTSDLSAKRLYVVCK